MGIRCAVRTSATIPANIEVSLRRRLAGLSNSASRPALSTITLSHSMIVCSRCAIIKHVASPNRLRIVDWISWSVSQSTDAVASSSRSSRGRRSNARARQITCFSPTEKFSPYSWTVASRPPFSSIDLRS